MTQKCLLQDNDDRCIGLGYLQTSLHIFALFFMLSALHANSLACIREESKTKLMATWNPSKDDPSGDYSSDYNNYISEKDDENDSLSEKPIQERGLKHQKQNFPMTDNSQNADPANEIQEAETQSQLMARYRFALMAGLVGILVLCSVGGYFLARRRDAALFRSEFASHSEALASVIENRLKEKVDILESLSVSLTTYAEAKQSKWPFVTVEDSGLLLSRFLERSETDAIAILPIVAAEKRLLWELYSVRLQGWISQEIMRSNSDVPNGNSRKLGEVDIGAPQANTSMTENQQSPTGDSASQWSRRQSFYEGTTDNPFASTTDMVGPPIPSHIRDQDGFYDRSNGPYVVSWQYAPVGERFSISNINLGTPDFARAFDKMTNAGESTLSRVYSAHENDASTYYSLAHSMHRILQERNETAARYSKHEPFGFIRTAVTESLRSDSPTVAVIAAMFQWRSFLENALPHGSVGVNVIVEDNTGRTFSYNVDKGEVNFIGEFDAHENKFDRHGVSISIEPQSSSRNRRLIDSTNDSVTFSIYPSTPTKQNYYTNLPIAVAVTMSLILALMFVLFWIYDSIVEFRHDLVMERVVRTEALVSNVFPKHIVDRLTGTGGRSVADDFPVASISCARRGSIFGNESTHSGMSVGIASRRGSVASRRMSVDSMMSGFGRAGGRRSSLDSGAGFNRRGSTGFRRMSLAQSDGTAGSRGDNAIADFYPEVSVFSWCSEREPTQESIYNAFDAIAARKNVYKVETIGDCYMAVVGLPLPNEHHALVLCEFARECMIKMHGLSKDLEIFLGPGTSLLDLRIGIHSGAVVAGVLRTGNARFQLFGDTVNVAARMESTGQAGCIQISQTTATELDRHGCRHWCTLRDDKIYAKGKGKLQTFWLHVDPLAASASSSVGRGIVEEDETTCNDDMNKKELSLESERLVNWMAEKLGHLLKQIETWHTMHVFPLASTDLIIKAEPTLVASEVREIVFSPTFYGAEYKGVSEVVEVDPKVVGQLKDLVRTIALLYPDNAFHNFAHSGHVTMSVIKLLARVTLASKSDEKGAAAMIASDPLAQFACIFAALIHDIEHPGVPNSQLVAEKTELAIQYEGKCVAESNSVTIAWSLLMEDRFKDLRRAIFCNEDELKRFRQLLVNLVIATDIVDPDLKKLRDDRWAKVFHQGDGDEEEDAETVADVEDVFDDYSSDCQRITPGLDIDDLGRRATIIIEYLILASDVSHMMQHFEVYRKWNEMFFQECVQAYQAGRAGKDPSLGWFKGELWFFDNYIIPLAGKLKDCKAFGVSSDEYLTFAQQNRQEWEEKGEGIVADMIAKYVV